MSKNLIDNSCGLATIEYSVLSLTDYSGMLKRVQVQITKFSNKYLTNLIILEKLLIFIENLFY